MPANNLLKIPLVDFVSPEVLPIWRKSIPHSHVVHYIVKPTAYDIVKRLGNARLEYSGAIGPDWFSMVRGSDSSAPLDAQAIFTWHFHPDASLTLSPEDWLCFLASSSYITGLFTIDKAVIVQKSPLMKDVCIAVRHCLCQNAKTPNLALRRVYSLLATYGCDLETMSDTNIGQVLHANILTGGNIACL